VSVAIQFAWLLILSIPVAGIAWTVTHEEIFREPRDYCQEQSKNARTFPRRKFFYLFSWRILLQPYVAPAFLIPTRFTLLYYDWRGYVIAFLAPVWVANQYMSVYNHLRLDIRTEQVQIHAEQKGGLPRERKAA
jgi:hypothetical protein